METTRLDVCGNSIEVEETYFDEQGNYCGDEDWYPNGYERTGLCIPAINFKTGEIEQIDPDVVYITPPTIIGVVYSCSDEFDFNDCPCDDDDEHCEEVGHRLFKVEGYDNPLIPITEGDLHDIMNFEEVKQVESHLYKEIHLSDVEKNNA